MFRITCILVFLILQSLVVKAQTQPQIFPRKNYVNFSSFYLESERVTTDDTNRNEDNTEILTGRPGVGLCLRLPYLTLRPEILVNPSMSSSEGSLYAGKDIFEFLEGGFFVALNHTDHSMGAGSTKNGIQISKSLFGIYSIFSFFNKNEFNFEILERISYINQKKTIETNGIETTLNKKIGAQFYTKATSNIKINQNIWFSPELFLIYGTEAEFAASNTQSSSITLGISLLNFRYEFF